MGKSVIGNVGMEPEAQSLQVVKKGVIINMRIGMGYDVHKLVENRDLVLGGVTIPYEKGLLGHSDADVLIHAIMDALLGAMALGDIGKHFPDTDEQYRGISSLELLKQVKKLIDHETYIIGNIDATIVAQQPKLAPHIPLMVENIARILEIHKNQVNIKATTEEGLGFTGSGEGISAQAICLLNSVYNYAYNRNDLVAYEYDPNAQAPSKCEGCAGCGK
jgi:2-C-methyl-D-erythritol 2,4-cyclodiphosphate synthase